jgi:radical SAM superfamily enzyme YgiQ (UPF0313 family)
LPHHRRHRLYLINPRFKYKHYAAQHELSRLVGKKRMTIPVQLPLLAALTPSSWDVEIIDDETDELVYRPLPDLVGISTVSATMGRVCEIADSYRSRGARVVLGGVYATYRPEVCLEHADHVIVGEAEGAWQRFLADFEGGTARQIYKNEEPPAFKRSVVPRWDLIDVASTMTVSVETSRGCPFDCDFCVVNKMFGHKMRFREIDDVIREIEAAPINRVFFVADNFALRKRYARELVRRLEPLKITWICQTSIQVADDPQFLREMADAGCSAMLIGFESLNAAALTGVKKHHNHIEEFERAIAAVHAVGIHVLASFIVGFDEDTLETFDVIEEFVERNDLLFTMMNILSIAPGTALFERMAVAGRVNAVESAYRNGIFPCMDYNNFSQRELFDRFFEVTTRLFSWERLSERALRLFSRGSFHRTGPEDVPTSEKISVMASLTRRFLFSPNAAKRRLFIELMKMVRLGTVAPDKVALFLLNMEAFNQFFREAEVALPAVRARIDAVDRGPFRARRVNDGAADGASPPLAVGCAAAQSAAQNRTMMEP